MKNIFINFLFISAPIFIAFILILIVYILLRIKNDKLIPPAQKKVKLIFVILLITIIVLPFLYTYLDNIPVKLKYLESIDIDTKTYVPPNNWEVITNEGNLKLLEEKLKIKLINDVNFSKELLYLSYGRKINKVTFSLFYKIADWDSITNPIAIFASDDNDPSKIYIYRAANNILPGGQGSFYYFNR